MIQAGPSLTMLNARRLQRSIRAAAAPGKTLLAANVAISLHLQQAGRVLLVDAGFRSRATRRARRSGSREVARRDGADPRPPDAGGVRQIPGARAERLLGAAAGRRRAAGPSGDAGSARRRCSSWPSRRLRLHRHRPAGRRRTADQTCIIDRPTTSSSSPIRSPASLPRARFASTTCARCRCPTRAVLRLPQPRARARRPGDRSDRARARLGRRRLTLPDDPEAALDARRAARSRC